jgi:DNA polymerase
MGDLLDSFPGLVALQHVYEERVYGCTRCELHKTRKRLMFGFGWSESPLIAFVGERPSAAEELNNALFSGENMELLRRGLDVLKLDASKMYYLHAVCCKPPSKRCASKSELQSCWPNMASQLLAVQPKVIMCLGERAAQSLLKTDLDLPSLRGKWHTFDRFDVRSSYALDQVIEGPEKIKVEFWNDLQEVERRTRNGDQAT